MLNGSNDLEKLHELSTYSYKNQAIWALNAYDSILEADAEKVWGYVKKFSQLDLDKKAEGSGLDEMNAHRFLESLGETLTVQELRNSLRKTGAVGQTERPKTVPLIQYLLYKYRDTIDWHKLVNASQGDNKAELEEAQRLLDQVNSLFEEARAKADAAAKALKDAENQEAEARKREEEAKKREAEAKQGEIDAAAAQRELEAALAELKSQEDEFNNKTNSLKSKSEDESVSVVGRNKAKNELAQHLASDPLPLRKAKISQEAAVKKSDKARVAAENARKAAEQARKDSESARRDAEKARDVARQAKEASDRAVEEAQAKVQEAEDYLNMVKRKPGVAQGAIWWLQRELDESKNYVPEKKGGVRKVDTTK